MADEKLSADQETERWRLEEMVSRIELALNFSAGMDATAVGLMRRALQNAKQQISRNEADIQRKAEEQKEATARQAMINELAARETALNTKERQEYAGFLKKEYFTRADFGRLENFYTHSWDKLSERGKDEMSHRVWEGIRRGEFKFQELPNGMKEREAQRVQQALQDHKELPLELKTMPENERKDFLRAREAGRKEEGFEMLNRSSGVLHVEKAKTGTRSKETVNSAAAVVKTAAEHPVQPALEQVAAHINMSSANKLKLQDIPSIDGAPLPERSGNPNSKGRA